MSKNVKVEIPCDKCCGSGTEEILLNNITKKLFVNKMVKNMSKCPFCDSTDFFSVDNEVVYGKFVLTFHCDFCDNFIDVTVIPIDLQIE